MRNEPIKIRDWKDFPHFLYLVPLFFVFHGYTQNSGTVTGKDFLMLTLEYMLLSVLLTAISFFFLKNWAKAAIFAFTLLFLHLFFGALHDALKQISPSFFLARYTVLLPFLLVTVVLIFVGLMRRKRDLRRLSVYLNLAFVVLLLSDLPALARSKPRTTDLSIFSACTEYDKPDIHLIIADGYPDSVVLKQFFRFNNNAFLQSLRSRGFHLVAGSRSNYNFTPFSTASILQMDYLQKIVVSNSNQQDLNICQQIINQNRVLDFLMANGYTVKNNSIFDLANQPTVARQKHTYTGTTLLASHTFIRRLRRDLEYHLVTTLKLRRAINRYRYYVRDGNQRLISRLKNEARNPTSTPRFVYTHLLMPHHPYYYNRHGEEQPPAFFRDGHESDEAAFIEYLQYSNGVFLSLIDSIQKQAAKPPIIVFMSDHGFREFADPGKRDAEREAQFMNLCAVLLPAGGNDAFYPGISAVNVFRAVLNASFGQNLPMLKDSTSFLAE